MKNYFYMKPETTGFTKDGYIWFHAIQLSGMKRTCIVFFTLLLAASCKSKDECRFTTAEELDKADLVKCKADAMYFFMRKFSLAFNDERKKAGIPLLPADYIAEVYTVGNQVRWHSEMDDRYFSKGLPYMKWKDLEWNGDTLKYDRSIFSEGKKEHPSNTLMIKYWLDTVSGSNQYLFTYEYSPKGNADDRELTPLQADSILKAWKLSY
jgi:hypothetical protein